MSLGPSGVQPHPHQRQLLRPEQLPVFQAGLPDALPGTLDHIALVAPGVPEQKVRQGGGRLLRMAPQHRQIFLHQLMGLHGGGELSGDLPPPGEHHDPAGDLVQPVHRGDIGGLLPLGLKGEVCPNEEE